MTSTMPLSGASRASGLSADEREGCWRSDVGVGPGASTEAILD
jgi:hypothetical protein